ncbi:MAG: HAD family hydrolase [Proteobacteria bacterium]|nr:HAD family hydrolase [Desulfobacula sp.]MBU3954267.1 HAD family hydrolase [Pseudomonadota bacterium]MBU4133444.1 HAD family hydrolase [Pseudomonadota bacterium]
MDISKIKAVVFDCDGVLFDTALANRKFYDEVLASFGKPELTDVQFVNVHMMTVTMAIEYLFPGQADHKAVFSSLKQIGYAKFIPYMSMEDGLIRLLTILKNKGFIRAIATNRTNTMEQVLKDYGLESYFEMVVTAADVKNPKPDPEQLLKIMETFHLDPREVIFIGDSEYDLRAARRAGTWFIAFKQEKLEADVFVDAMEDILGVLQINE